VGAFHLYPGVLVGAEVDVFVVKVLGDGEDFFDGSAEAVQFPDAEGVAWSEVVERGDQSRAGWVRGWR